MKEFCTDVVVIGAGHAGIEAALATSRMGVDTVLFTINLDAVGNMPCNPSIGGSAKGHLVFEIDALGGEMGRAADAASIQSRTLNLGKGSAVHAKRVQTDRARYKEIMKKTLEKEECRLSALNLEETTMQPLSVTQRTARKRQNHFLRPFISYLPKQSNIHYM